MENLSDDVLLEVFEFLDAKTLKNAALVCKKYESSLKTKIFQIQCFDKFLIIQLERSHWLIAVNDEKVQAEAFFHQRSDERLVEHKVR